MYQRRARQHHVTEQDLHAALGLTADERVHGVAWDPVRCSVRIVVESPRAELVPPDAEPLVEPLEAPLVFGSGVHMIAVERHRQVEVEGYHPGHDAEHEADALALAGACYATPEDLREFVDGDPRREPTLWPFEGGWKPSTHDRARELTKAGALIAAELDRITGHHGPTMPRFDDDPIVEARRLLEVALDDAPEDVAERCITDALGLLGGPSS